ncbi:M20/M25/M40 family metallo-hydrolase [Capillimicrobium parvum]|uniref:M20/M25/M40 family metallo-hydrolase n=1 Tax=Capillimicrobium parvum TaxID=2884022 RepID=UPI00216B1429|nr:M20/M25/M40 family metallo-hydrolase [Capillimicrobium parvum]
MLARPTDAERRRLHGLFAELCAIDSPFGHEQACADRVEAELRRIGLDVERDDFGNLLARVPPPAGSERWLLMCAHLDTVPRLDPSTPIEPVEVDEGWENAHADILGADNKAAVAAMLLTAERAANDGSPVGLELLFTLQEENALVGAKAFDVGRLRSRFGYVYDHATPIGEIVLASPTYYRFEATFHGQAAHAGIRPEDGRSAIVAAARAIASLRLGRIDDETTANVGTIHGGVGGTNVVPEHCRFVGEVRSIDDAKAEALVTETIERIHAAANEPTCDVDVDVSVARLFSGYRHRPTSPAVGAAEEALRACGYEPGHIHSGGGSDANAFEAAGLHCVCLANGTQRNHEPTERVSFDALEGMLAVSFALLATAVAVDAPA